MYWLGVSVLCVALASSDQHICHNPSYVYRSPGDAIIAGFFGAHSGPNCSVVEASGMQLMQATIAAVEAIRANNFIPGIRLGLTLYDTCTQEEMTKKSLISAMVDADCKQEYLIGGLVESGGGGLGAETWALASDLSLPLSQVGAALNSSLVLSLAARVVDALGWSPVSLLSRLPESANTFTAASSLLGLCVSAILSPQQVRSDDGSALVVLGEAEGVREILASGSYSKVLLVPLGSDLSQLTEGDVHPQTRVLAMVETSLEVSLSLKNPLNITEEETSTSRATVSSHTSPATLRQIQILSDILKTVSVFKTAVSKHCSSDWELCPELGRVRENATRGDITHNAHLVKSALKVLRVDPGQFRPLLLLEEGEVVGRIGVSPSASVWEVRLAPNASVEEASCSTLNCSDCINTELKEVWPLVTLKPDAWVAAVVSIATVGVLACVAVSTFILVRVCKGDILEGNPSFSLIILLSLILTYSSVVPFCLDVPESHRGLLCGLRISSTSLSYALVFSSMLSRSLLLASCDRDGGLMSHINGYLQSSLCFFIALVQIGLAVQFWAINWVFLEKDRCGSMLGNNTFLALLGYDALLLLLLLLVSPLIARSKRNYQEGGYFVVASVLMLLVWIGWTGCYAVGPEEYREACACAGLVATSSVVLVTVFLPRTYLMVSGIVRDHLVSTLPSLAHTASTSVVDVQYRSTQGLYDQVHPPRGLINPNFYTDQRAATPSTSKLPEPSYERY